MKENIFLKMLLLSLGAFFVFIGIDYFLVPNQIIDGGIVGVSIILNYLLKYPIGVILIILNIPFLFLAKEKLGIKFVCCTVFASVMLALFEHFITYHPVITHDLTLACVFGGLTIGVGVGLILRNNGALDGTEIVAIRLAQKVGFSVGEIIMFINVFIFIAAGFVFGPERAMYSVLTYFIIFKTIDIILEGLDESKSIMVISLQHEEVGKALMEKLNRGVTYIEAQGGYTKEKKQIVYCVVSRLEIAKAKNIIREADPSAFIAIENVHEVECGKARVCSLN